MKLREALKVGFIPISLDGILIDDFIYDHRYNVVHLSNCSGESRYVSGDLDVEDIKINLQLQVKYTEELASALMLSGVAPVTPEHLDSTTPRKREARERHYRNSRSSRSNVAELATTSPSISSIKNTNLF